MIWLQIFFSSLGAAKPPFHSQVWEQRSHWIYQCTNRAHKALVRKKAPKSTLRLPIAKKLPRLGLHLNLCKYSGVTACVRSAPWKFAEFSDGAVAAIGSDLRGACWPRPKNLNFILASLKTPELLIIKVD